MMRFRHVVVASGALAMVALSASLTMAQAPEGRGGGQRGAAPPEPHNLKVLPASTTTAQILPIMRAFSGALGTNCGYCHVWTGPGLPTNDYASDEKPAAGAMFLGSRDTGSARPVMRSGRRALAAAFVGLVAMGALRRKG